MADAFDTLYTPANSALNSNSMPTMTDVTRILSAIEQGDPHGAEQLLPLVYDELRKLAAQKLAKEKPGQTLDATALVHEAYLRLVGDQHFANRRHFFAAAAEAMRRIPVESARRKQGPKQGGGIPRGLSGTFGKGEVGPPVRETILVLDGDGEPGELLLERPLEAGLLLLVAGGRLQDEDGPLRERPRLLVRPVRRGADVDVLVLQLFGLLLTIVIPQAQGAADEDPPGRTRAL